MEADPIQKAIQDIDNARDFLTKECRNRDTIFPLRRLSIENIMIQSRCLLNS